MFFFSHVYSPRQRQTTHRGQKFYDNRKTFSLCPYVASFKMMFLKSDFIHIFNDFIHIAPGQGQKTPCGHTFDVNRKPLPLRSFVASFKQISLNSDFIHIFKCFFHMYIAPGQGQKTFCGQNSDVNRKALSLCPFAASFKEISLKSDFIHIFACFYTCI